MKGRTTFCFFFFQNVELLVFNKIILLRLKILDKNIIYGTIILSTQDNAATNY